MASAARYHLLDSHRQKYALLTRHCAAPLYHTPVLRLRYVLPEYHVVTPPAATHVTFHPPHPADVTASIKVHAAAPGAGEVTPAGQGVAESPRKNLTGW